MSINTTTSTITRKYLRNKTKDNLISMIMMYVDREESIMKSVSSIDVPEFFDTRDITSKFNVEYYNKYLERIKVEIKDSLYHLTGTEEVISKLALDAYYGRNALHLALKDNELAGEDIKNPRNEYGKLCYDIATCM